MQSIWIAIWKSLVFFIIWAIPLALFTTPFQTQLKKTQETNPPMAQLYFEFASVISIVIAAFLLVTFIDKRTFVSLGFDPKYIFHDFILGIFIGLLWLAISLGVIVLIGWAISQR